MCWLKGFFGFLWVSVNSSSLTGDYVDCQFAGVDVKLFLGMSVRTFPRGPFKGRRPMGCGCPSDRLGTWMEWRGEGQSHWARHLSALSILATTM